MLYQFSARGHEVTQVLLGRCSPALGMGWAATTAPGRCCSRSACPIDEALASTMMRVGSMSEGRDIGVVFNLPRRDGPCVLPVCGGVGTQYTPAVGWAQALRYREDALGDARCAGSIAVAHGGDASTATNGFWSALNIATTERLPLLFFIEDNGYGISVPTELQTPAATSRTILSAFRGLRVLDGDGSDPLAAGAADPRGGRRRARGRGTGTAAAHGAAAVGPLRPGHPDVQGVRGHRGRAGARSVAQAPRAARAHGAFGRGLGR